MPNDLTGEPAKNERDEDSYALEACLARFPGAIRPETGKRQALLYLA